MDDPELIKRLERAERKALQGSNPSLSAFKSLIINGLHQNINQESDFLVKKVWKGPFLYEPKGSKKDNEWFVWYRYPRPEDERKFKKFRIGRGFNRFTTLVDKRRYGSLLIATIEKLLANGYTPYDTKSGYGSAGPNSTARFIEKYLDDVKHNIRPGTFVTYFERLNVFKRWLKDNNLMHLRPFQITRGMVVDFLERYSGSKKLANKTYNHYLSAIHTFFEYLISNYDDVIEKNICVPIKRLQVLKKGNRPFSGDEFTKVLEYTKVHEPYLYEFIRHLYYTCMRPDAELRVLKLHDIDVNGRRILVHASAAKSKISQWIPIDDNYYEILRDMKLHQYPGTYYLFGKGGGPSDETMFLEYFRKKFRDVKRRLGLHPDTTLYAFKHTRVIHMYQDGEMLHNIIRFTRHSTLAELMDYMKDMGLVLGETKTFKSRKL